ncbi:MAG: glycosyltransferase [Anderseniella sp.]
MRIAYLTNRYPAASHSFIRREIIELEELGFEIMRVSIRPSGEDVVDEQDRMEATKTKIVLDGSRLAIVGRATLEAVAHFNSFLRGFVLAFRVGRRSEQGLLWHIFYLIEALVMTRWCRDTGVEHIHAHFGTNSATVAMLVNALGGIQYSFTVHGPDEFDRPEGIYLGEKIRRSNFVVAVSSYGRSQLMRWVEIAHWDKIKVVHCGIDQSFVEADPITPPQIKRLVCVARLARQKGLALLVEACAILKKRDVEFEVVLVGDGELRSYIEAQIDQLGVHDVVKIIGWLTGEQVRDEIHAAKVLVLPSFAEGLPVVIMEAMALGRPVIATYTAGIPELLKPGVNGWLVPAGDVEAFADAMQEAINCSTSKIEKMGRAGRQRVLERHNVITEAEKLRDLFANSKA